MKRKKPKLKKEMDYEIWPSPKDEIYKKIGRAVNRYKSMVDNTNTTEVSSTIRQFLFESRSYYAFVTRLTIVVYTQVIYMIDSNQWYIDYTPLTEMLEDRIKYIDKLYKKHRLPRISVAMGYYNIYPIIVDEVWCNVPLSRKDKVGIDIDRWTIGDGIVASKYKLIGGSVVVSDEDDDL